MTNIDLITKALKNRKELYAGENEVIAKILHEAGVIALPCQIGKTVYDIGEFFECAYHPEMYELDTDYITLSKDEGTGELLFGIDSIDFKCEDFGKTVFLNRDEAEKALNERIWSE